MLNEIKIKEILLKNLNDLLKNVDNVDKIKIDKLVDELYDLNIVCLKPLDEKATYIIRKRFGCFDKGVIQTINEIKDDTHQSYDYIRKTLKRGLTQIYEYRLKRIERTNKVSSFLLVDNIFNIHTICLDLDTRIINALMSGIEGNRICSLYELLTYDKNSLYKIRNLGKLSVDIIVNKIHEMNFLFIDELDKTDKKKLMDIYPEDIIDNSSLYLIDGMNPEIEKVLYNMNVFTIGDLRRRFNQNSIDEINIKDIVFLNKDFDFDESETNPVKLYKECLEEKKRLEKRLKELEIRSKELLKKINLGKQIY